MAKKSTVTLSLTITGDGITTTYVPPTAPIVNNTAPAGGPILVALSTGDNDLTVPAGATSVLIVPLSDSAVVKKLKGDAADVGVTIAPASPTLLGLPSGATEVTINAASGETISVVWL